MLRSLCEVLNSDVWIGDGPMAKRCEALIREQIGVPHAYLTPSCTSALEMACVLAGIGHGDEVIMPSFGFSSAGNAVVLRGGVPVFVDVRPDTLNIDETLVEGAITRKTKAIIVVHYAGVMCEMPAIYGVVGPQVLIIEDAAQAYLSRYQNLAAGTWGDISAFSFHQTKNIRCGEGGALTLPEGGIGDEFATRAEVLREKGTDRAAFLRGEVQRYTWTDVGFSGVVSEFQAAVLLAQLERAKEITERRLALWDRYHHAMTNLDYWGKVRRPTVPPHCQHNGHIYRILLPTQAERDRILAALNADGVKASFHFQALHSAPAGLRYGRVSGSMAVTDSVCGRLLRMPLSHATTEEDVDRAVDRLEKALRG
jgi:dTDP-4-amino-4,6-dideoxygalactose transaminase